MGYTRRGMSQVWTPQMPIPCASPLAGAQALHAPSTPANSATRTETPLLHSTYRGWSEPSSPPAAFLSFLPRSPSSSCWRPLGALALASGEQERPPGLTGPGGAQLPACSFGG